MSGYRPQYSLEAATAIATGTIIDCTGIDWEPPPRLFIVILGTATVLIEGAGTPVAAQFINVSDPPTGYTTSTILQVDPGVPYYRGRVSAHTSGTVSVYMGPARAGGLLANVSAPSATSGGPPP